MDSFVLSETSFRERNINITAPELQRLPPSLQNISSQTLVLNSASIIKTKLKAIAATKRYLGPTGQPHSDSLTSNSKSETNLRPEGCFIRRKKNTNQLEDDEVYDE